MPGSGSPGAQRHRPTRVLIMGAAGRDFHNFNVVFRDRRDVRVVAFTAAQIPDIAGRRYPPSLAGRLYPRGIPIYPEEELARLVRRLRVDQVCLAYSDLPHVEVMHLASTALAAGASFVLLGPNATMLRARVPVVSVCAVRTGVGKSPTSRRVVRWLLERGHRVAVVRHPMPYGDLERQAAQRFASYDDLDAAGATIEEREEYEPYLALGVPVFAGVDYVRVLAMAEAEASVVLWDGGNNDFPFVRPDLHLVLLDPHRPGHELAYHPGETNLRMADAFIVTKVGSAPRRQVEEVVRNARRARPGRPVVLADLRLTVDRPELVRGRRVLVVGDGPTLTHGGLGSGAGTLAAQQWGAAEVVPARPHAVGSIADAFRQYPHLDREVPAMGYSPAQVRDLEATINAVPADVVLDASPVDLGRLVRVDKPIVAVSYELEERGPGLARLLERFEARHLRGEARHGAPVP